MSTKNFFNFHNGTTKKPTGKPAGTNMVKQNSNPPRVFQPNIGEMKRVFDKFDTNKDGKISLEEYELASRVMGKGNTKANVANIFKEIDTDGDGFLGFQEIMNAQNMGGGVSTDDMKSAFRVFDLDGNGKISAEELFEVMKRLGERCNLHACLKMVKVVDVDGDGLIDMDEFMNMMTNNMKLA